MLTLKIIRIWEALAYSIKIKNRGVHKMKTIIRLIIALFFVTFAYAGELTKQQSFHHSVTEDGTIQVRMVTEYLDNGKFVDKKLGPPMTPADTSNMDGWDQRSKNIVETITDPKVIVDFAIETDTHKVENQTGGLAQEVSWDRVIDNLGRISIRRIIRIYEDGKVAVKKYHRSWIMPGQDASTADVMSRAIAEKIHTQAVIDAYKAKMVELAEAVK